MKTESVLLRTSQLEEKVYYRLFFVFFNFFYSINKSEVTVTCVSQVMGQFSSLVK